MDIPPVIQPNEKPQVYTPHPYKVNDNKKATKIANSFLWVLLVSFLLAVFVVGISEVLSRRQARIEKDKIVAKEKRTMLILDNLKKQYPNLVFALYSDFIVFNTNVGKCNINSISLKRKGNSIDVITRVQGVYPEPKAPDIFLTLYDENGYPIFRKHCVEFYFATLGPGCVQDVDDTMLVGIIQPIQFISIDPFENVIIINNKLVQMGD